MKKTNNNGTSRGWIITLFGIDGLPECWPTPKVSKEDLPVAQVQADFHALFETDPGLQYAVWQIEVAPSTGSVHLQGYLHYSSPIRGAHIRKLIGGSVHYEARRGSVSDAIAYCKKEDTRLIGPWEYGTVPSGQGSRSDIDALAVRLKEGVSLNDAVDGNEAVFVKFHRGFMALQSVYQQRRLQAIRTVTTTVKYGPTGVGKTYSIISKHGLSVFIVPPPQGGLIWWDGYTGQEVVLFDDFYGQVKPADMLRYLDVYPCQIPIKGGMVWANWRKVYITSNVHPDDWWPKADLADSVRAAIQRRLTKIVHVTSRPQ